MGQVIDINETLRMRSISDHSLCNFLWFVRFCELDFENSGHEYDYDLAEKIKEEATRRGLS